MNQEVEHQESARSFPFNNLYLISGLVNGFNKVWMYLFTISFLMLGYLSFQLMALFPLTKKLNEKGYSESDILNNPSLIFDSAALGIDRNVIFLIELGMFVFAFLGFFIGLRYVHQKSLTSVLTGYHRFRFGRFWFAFLVWSVMPVVSVVLSYFTDPGSLTLTFNPMGFLFTVIITFTLMPIQTGLEEVVFRGYLVQGLAQIVKNGIVPLLFTSALFALAHMQNPEVKQYGWQIMFVYFFLFAMYMGGITLIDEGIELAFGIHLANNAVSSILVSTPHSVVRPYSLFEAAEQDPSSEIILWVVLATVTFFIFKYKYKWRDFSLLIK